MPMFKYHIFSRACGYLATTTRNTALIALHYGFIVKVTARR